MILSPHEIAYLALNVGQWTPDDATIMVAIALAESGGDTDIIGRSKDPNSASYGQRDHGLFQISGRWMGRELQTYRWRDPYDNTRMARIAWNFNGFSAWNVTDTGAQLQFLPDAKWGIARPFPPPPAQAGWRT
jgi:Lysozyme like domain